MKAGCSFFIDFFSSGIATTTKKLRKNRVRRFAYLNECKADCGGTRNATTLYCTEQICRWLFGLGVIHGMWAELTALFLGITWQLCDLGNLLANPGLNINVVFVIELELIRIASSLLISLWISINLKSRKIKLSCWEGRLLQHLLCDSSHLSGGRTQL